MRADAICVAEVCSSRRMVALYILTVQWRWRTVNKHLRETREICQITPIPPDQPFISQVVAGKVFKKLFKVERAEMNWGKGMHANMQNFLE